MQSLKPAEASMRVNYLCDKAGLNEAAFQKWRSKLRSVDVPDAKRLREMEAEDARLKTPLARVF